MMTTLEKADLQCAALESRISSSLEALRDDTVAPKQMGVHYENPWLLAAQLQEAQANRDEAPWLEMASDPMPDSPTCVMDDELVRPVMDMGSPEDLFLQVGVIMAGGLRSKKAEDEDEDEDNLKNLKEGGRGQTSTGEGTTMRVPISTPPWSFDLKDPTANDAFDSLHRHESSCRFSAQVGYAR